ncbi:MAG: hypothetical protein ACU0CO_00560 [Shimia sp.]
MSKRALRCLTLPSSAALLAACVATTDPARVAGWGSYDGVATTLLAPDLVQIGVAMSGLPAPHDLRAYADCAVAQYALIRGYGFARHVRTTATREGSVYRADAVYTVSRTIPAGTRAIDAEVAVADCREQGIPTV